jgi:hypothetical protein
MVRTSYYIQWWCLLCTWPTHLLVVMGNGLKIIIGNKQRHNRFLIHYNQENFFFCKLNKCGHRNVLSKRQVWMSIFHNINFKKKIMDTGVLDFFNKKLILDYYFCLKSGPVFLFQIFIIAPLPLPSDIKLYH